MHVPYTKGRAAC